MWGLGHSTLLTAHNRTRFRLEGLSDLGCFAGNQSEHGTHISGGKASCLTVLSGTLNLPGGEVKPLFRGLVRFFAGPPQGHRFLLYYALGVAD